ncbi:MAG: transposase [Chloroflexota bacterium]
MARKRYTAAQKAEAVALARVSGAGHAAEQLGIDVRTIRAWVGAAGDPPELDGTAAGWQQLLDLAHSQVVSALTGGKVRPKDAAVIAAISERNLREIEKHEGRRASDEQGAIAARDAYFDWLVDRIELPDEIEDAIFTEYEQAFLAIQSELLGRANAELPADRPTAAWNPEGSHRLALLHWYNDAEDTPAGDVLEWAREQTTVIIEEHGSLLGWYHWSEAVTERDKVIRQRADVLWREGGMRLHEAEAFVREHLADDLRIPEPGAFS